TYLGGELSELADAPEHRRHGGWIHDVVSVGAPGGRGEDGRQVDVADAERIEVRQHAPDVHEGEPGVELQSVGRARSATRRWSSVAHEIGIARSTTAPGLAKRIRGAAPGSDKSTSIASASGAKARSSVVNARSQRVPERGVSASTPAISSGPSPRRRAMTQ